MELTVSVLTVHMPDQSYERGWAGVPRLSEVLSTVFLYNYHSSLKNLTGFNVTTQHKKEGSGPYPRLRKITV